MRREPKARDELDERTKLSVCRGLLARFSSARMNE
jgi:hypothetical protein